MCLNGIRTCCMTQSYYICGRATECSDVVADELETAQTSACCIVLSQSRRTGTYKEATDAIR